MVGNSRISAVLVSTDLERSRGFYSRSAWFKDPDDNTIALFQSE